MKKTCFLAVEHLQHIEFIVLFVEVETALVLIRFALAGNAEGEDKTDSGKARSQPEKCGICTGCDGKGKGQHYEQIAGKRAYLVHCALGAQRFALMSGLCIA